MLDTGVTCQGACLTYQFFRMDWPWFLLWRFGVGILFADLIFYYLAFVRLFVAVVHGPYYTSSLLSRLTFLRNNLIVQVIDRELHFNLKNTGRN